METAMTAMTPAMGLAFIFGTISILWLGWTVYLGVRWVLRGSTRCSVPWCAEYAIGAIWAGDDLLDFCPHHVQWAVIQYQRQPQRGDSSVSLVK